jgi:hypothetical protein
VPVNVNLISVAEKERTASRSDPDQVICKVLQGIYLSLRVEEMFVSYL